MRLYIFLFFFIISVSCQSISNLSLINTTHLDNLYKEIPFGQDTTAFIYIYAEHPSYKPVEAGDEGIACVDDVARAAIFYFRYYKQTNDLRYLYQAKHLLNFILHLQAENGLYYNFIRADYTINKTRKNSRAIADWWTWRALWALSEGISYAKGNESEFYQKLLTAFNKTMDGLEEQGIQHLLDTLAADQASVFLMALTQFNRVVLHTDYRNYIFQLAHNIMSKQRGDKETFPYYAFMSWRNEWHGWGNTQAYALLKAANLTGDMEMLQAASNEIKYFYPYFLSKNHLKQFVLINDEQSSHFEFFEQIAYAIRPMVWASLELYHSTGNEIYAEQAGKLAAWLAGENVLRKRMYDPQTGRCYDGINSADKINVNSGAESTIEALLILIEVEQNPVANKHLQFTYQRYQK